jgi:hypothetical protein
VSDTPFSERWDKLREMIGPATIEGQVVVDQVYARYQDGRGDAEEGALTPTEYSRAPGPGEFGLPGELWTGKLGIDFDHPRGGEAGYLSEGLDVQGGEIIGRIENAIGEEKPLRRAVRDGMDKLADTVYDAAPVEWWVLRNSANPRVLVGDEVVYDRPPVVPRLSQSELDAIRKSSDPESFNEQFARPFPRERRSFSARTLRDGVSVFDSSIGRKKP